jgi:hypothetical protein
MDGRSKGKRSIQGRVSSKRGGGQHSVVTDRDYKRFQAAN